MKYVLSALSGLIFGLGLIMSNMVNPEKIKAFLTVTRHWDPSLALVMVSALSLFIPAHYIIKKTLNRPLLSQTFMAPTHAHIDIRLILGAMLFGIGWGLSGLCPGPAIVNIGTGEPKILVFIFMLFVGMHLPKYANMLKRKWNQNTP